MKVPQDRHTTLADMGFFRKKKGYVKVSIEQEYVILIMPLRFRPEVYDIRVELLSFCEHFPLGEEDGPGLWWGNQLVEGCYHTMDLIKGMEYGRDEETISRLFDEKIKTILQSIHDPQSLCQAKLDMDALFGISYCPIDLPIYLGRYDVARELIENNIRALRQCISWAEARPKTYEEYIATFRCPFPEDFPAKKRKSAGGEELDEQRKREKFRAYYERTQKDLRDYHQGIESEHKRIQKIENGDIEDWKAEIEERRRINRAYCLENFTESDKKHFVQ